MLVHRGALVGDAAASVVASALPRPRALQGDRLSMGIDSMDDITAPVPGNEFRASLRRHEREGGERGTMTRLMGEKC